MSNTVPNLDAMPESDLMSFWSRYHRASRKDAEALVGDKRKGYTGLAADLACYACNKAVAMGMRLKGDISGALNYERYCEIIYRNLPADLRW